MEIGQRKKLDLINMRTLLNYTSVITINNTPRIYYLPTSSNPHHRAPRNSNSGHDKGLIFTAMSSHHHPGSRNDVVDATGESVHESRDSKFVETSCTGGHVEESSNSSKETEEDESNKRSSAAGRGKLPIPIKLPGWAIWAIGSLILLAIPFHKKILKFEGKLEQAIGTVIDEVQAAAPIVKKIAGEIADSLPKDSKLAQDLELIEKLAEEVEESADKAEAFIDKVEEIRDVIEDAIDPIIEASQKKTTETKSD